MKDFNEQEIYLLNQEMNKLENKLDKIKDCIKNYVCNEECGHDWIKPCGDCDCRYNNILQIIGE